MVFSELANCEAELKNDCACVTYGQSAGRRRENLDFEQQISNVKSIAERWRYFAYFYITESFSFPKRFIYLHGIAFSGPLLLKLSKGKRFCLFYWPFVVHSCFTSCIFAAWTLDFVVKFWFCVQVWSCCVQEICVSTFIGRSCAKVFKLIWST